jgi:hypothetical protein
MLRHERASRRSRLRTIGWLVLAASLVGATTAVAASLSLSSKTLTVFRTCVITATPSTSTADIDALVDQATATTTHGSTVPMDVESFATNKNRRIYIKFDLTKCSPSIPSSASVKVATLRLYLSALPTACRTEDVFRVTSTWAEGTITWNNQPFGTSVNNPASGSRTSSFSVGPAACGNTATGYVTGGDVTADVQAFVSSTATNFGWMIRDDVENASTTARDAQYAPRETNVLTASPQLVITYIT